MSNSILKSIDKFVQKQGKEALRLLFVFKLVKSKLKEKVEVFIAGGANMAIRKLKISTKDIDLIVRRKHFEPLKKALISLGFKQNGSFFEKENLRIDLFVDGISSSYSLSKDMIERAELYWSGEKLSAYLLSMEDLFLFKSFAGREVDIEDCRILAEKGLNWSVILKEAVEQQEKTDRVITITLLDALDILKDKYKIDVPITRKLEPIVLQKLILYSLEKSKTVKELVYILQKPESTIRKQLKKLLEQGKITRVKKGKQYLYVKR